MRFLSSLNFDLYEIFIRMCLHSYGLSYELSPVGFHLWVFTCDCGFSPVTMGCHLWGFLLRSVRMKYASKAFFLFFWWNDHHTNILLRWEACFHHYITPSHIFFKYMSSLFLRRCRSLIISESFQHVRIFLWRVQI